MSNLSQDLALLQARGLMRVSSEGSGQVYRFKHALTRRATYETILQSRRAELHRAAAETLAALHPRPDLEMTLTIAEHWQRAGDDAQTLQILLPHAQALVYSGRSVSLTALLTRLARENLTTVQQRDLDISLADAQSARGEYEPARVLYDRLIPQADSIPLQIMLHHRRGAAAYHLGDYEDAQRDYAETLELARTNNDPLYQARAYSGLGLVAWSRGDVDTALAHLETSRRMSLPLGRTMELANIEFNLAGVLLDQGKYSQAIVAAERAYTLYQELANHSLAARTLQLIGACHYTLGHLEQARNFYERALAASREVDDKLGVAQAHYNLGELWVTQAELERAIAEYELAIQEFRRLELDYHLSGALAGLAEARLFASRQSPALLSLGEANIGESLEIATRIGSPEREGVANRIRAEIFLARGELDAALTHAEHAIELLERIHAGLELDKARATLGRVQTAGASKLHTRDHTTV